MRVLVLVGLVAATLPWSSGCLAKPPVSNVDTAAAADEPATNATLPSTDTTEDNLAASVARPMGTSSFGGSTIITPSSNVTGFVIEIEWTPSTPASQEMSLWVRRAGAGDVMANPTILVMPVTPVAVVSGASPLRLALAADAFPEEADYEVLFRAAQPVGIAVDQPFTRHISTFAGMAFDENFSHIGSAHGHA